MTNKKPRSTGNSILRLIFVGISLLLQAGWLLLKIFELNQYSTVLYVVTQLIALLVVLRLYAKHTTSAMKMPWIMLILVFPVMGLSLYILVELIRVPKLVRKRLNRIRKAVAEHCPPEPQPDFQDPIIGNQFRYLAKYGNGPAYSGTDTVYYSQAAEAFEAMLEAVSQAKQFIFMEYFIITDAGAFQRLEQLLVQKAAEGVEIRIMYDDIGSIGYLNRKFAKRLNREGIACRVFNPVVPVLSLLMNHRDHRKITVIDGKIGFTGGYNLADEYFGLTQPYGHWKDTGLRLEGPAVRSLTALFLELWNIRKQSDQDFTPYLAPVSPVPDAEGIVAPFGDTPLESERLAETVYMNLISGAKKSVYLMTPYLIITDEMRQVLGNAAKRGVDVRIITPGIPDKKIIYSVTRSYYNSLAIQGVRIYEYTPGFCHAKQCLCDGEIASIGTSNLDYRSLYHHFENNVLLYNCPAVRQMADDFEELFPQCREVTEIYRSGRSALLRTGQCILRLFAPLL